MCVAVSVSLSVSLVRCCVERRDKLSFVGTCKSGGGGAREAGNAKNKQWQRDHTLIPANTSWGNVDLSPRVSARNRHIHLDKGLNSAKA